MNRCAASVGIGLALLLGGCGDTARPNPARVSATATPAATASPRPPQRRHRAALAADARLVDCDANISARAKTTTCGFAQNVFYSFWQEGIPDDSQNAIHAFSPASGENYAVACSTDEADNVTCVAGDGAEVHFRLSAVRQYDQEQATRYAATHDLGPQARAAEQAVDPGNGYGAEDPVPSSETSEAAPADADPPLDERIPNYDEGRGSPVQCSDGMWSQSGGIQGACSGHGGVG